jgi:hypothetical protein
MVLLGDEAPVEARYGPFGDSNNLEATLRHDLCQMYHRLKNRFGRTRCFSYVGRLVLVHLEIVLILTQDRCIVCVECTIRLGSHFGHTRWNS